MRIKLTSVMVDDQEQALRFYTEALGGVAQRYQKMLFDAGIPAAFAVDNIRHEYDRLQKLGVVFVQDPTAMGPTTVAVLDDTCGNLIQLYQL